MARHTRLRIALLAESELPTIVEDDSTDLAIEDLCNSNPPGDPSERVGLAIEEATFVQDVVEEIRPMTEAGNYRAATEHLVSRLNRRLGFNYSVSVEGFGDMVVKTAKAIGRGIKALIEAILNAIRSFGEWIASFFKRSNDVSKKQLDAISKNADELKAGHEEVLKARKHAEEALKSWKEMKKSTAETQQPQPSAPSNSGDDLDEVQAANKSDISDILKKAKDIEEQIKECATLPPLAFLLKRSPELGQKLQEKQKADYEKLMAAVGGWTEVFLKAGGKEIIAARNKGVEMATHSLSAPTLLVELTKKVELIPQLYKLSNDEIKDSHAWGEFSSFLDKAEAAAENWTKEGGEHDKLIEELEGHLADHSAPPKKPMPIEEVYTLDVLGLATGPNQAYRLDPSFLQFIDPDPTRAERCTAVFDKTMKSVKEFQDAMDRAEQATHGAPDPTAGFMELGQRFEKVSRTILQGVQRNVRLVQSVGRISKNSQTILLAISEYLIKSEQELFLAYQKYNRDRFDEFCDRIGAPELKNRRK